MQRLCLQVIARMALVAYWHSCFTVMLLVALQQHVVGLDVTVRQWWAALVQGLNTLADLQQQRQKCQFNRQQVHHLRRWQVCQLSRYCWWDALVVERTCAELECLDSSAAATATCKFIRRQLNHCRR